MQVNKITQKHSYSRCSKCRPGPNICDVLHVNISTVLHVH